jgi:hypothetical protein
MTRQAVNYLIREAGERAGLGRVWPHMLRHSCGFALDNNVPTSASSRTTLGTETRGTLPDIRGRQAGGLRDCGDEIGGWKSHAAAPTQSWRGLPWVRCKTRRRPRGCKGSSRRIIWRPPMRHSHRTCPRSQTQSTMSVTVGKADSTRTSSFRPSLTHCRRACVLRPLASAALASPSIL